MNFNDKNIKFNENIDIEILKEISEEGLVLQGCGGDIREWVVGINELFTEENILLDGDYFKEVSSFKYEGLTNLLFNMEDVKLNMGKLAIWRLQTHNTFGGTWLSDYLPNKLGVEMGDLSDDSPILS